MKFLVSAFSLVLVLLSGCANLNNPTPADGTIPGLSPIHKGNAHRDAVTTLALPNDLWERIRKGYSMPSSFSSNDALNAFNVQAVGTFMVQQDFDNKYIFSNIGFLRFMMDLKTDEYSALDIKAGAVADQVKKDLQVLLGNSYLVQTRYEQNQSLYTVMQIEKWVIYGILSLILVVAAFNMIGALTMLVLEKQKDISVLQALGANANRIRNIFLTEGMLLAAVGGVSGMLLAAIICWIQLKFQLIKLGGDTFIINYYPVKLLLTDFLLVGGTVFIISILAAYLPSRKASQQSFSLKS